MLRRNWGLIDRHAEKASHDDAKTFDSLQKYFERVIPNDIDRDINMVRGLTYWMYCYETWSIPKGYTKTDGTPLKLLADLHQDKLSYAEAYATICTRLGVTCEMVKGMSKSGQYQPGDTPTQQARDNMVAIWNKVFLEGKWWPVYPRWIMKTSTHTQPAGASGPDSAAVRPTGFKEFWFLTDPELFIYKCYPDDIEHQMLPKSKQVKTVKKFFQLPYLTIPFFKANLKLMSEQSCVIDADEGLAKVHFKAEKIPSRKLAFTCRLTVRERGGKAIITQHFDIHKLVLNARNKGNFIFEVRCPSVADYILEIVGGPIEAPQKKVYMITKVICREKLPTNLILPIDAGYVGWGFGPYAGIEGGLVKSNIHAPKISVIPNGKKVHLEIKIDKDVIRKMQYQVELIEEANRDNKDLKKCVKSDVNTESCTLTIDAGVPRNGEFALVIKRAEIGQPTFKAVCHFLLTTFMDEETVEDEYYDSSDGTSDIDEEIDDLRTKVEEMRQKRDQLLQKYGGQEPS